MRFKRIGGWLGCVLALLWAGCVTDGVKVKPVACSFDELKCGDNVILSFSDLPPPGIADQKLRVKDDGTISLIHNESVLAAGKKVAIVEKEIQEKLVPKYYRQITVTIKTEERFIFVGGEVKTPGRLVYQGETTVLRAIQSAGDFTAYAKQASVHVTRANGDIEIVNCKKARRNPRLDVIICPGDSIHVDSRIL